MVDAVAEEYLDEVAFVAVAGRSTLDKTSTKAAQLFSGNIAWGLDESVWGLYGAFGQPYTVLITADDRIAASWYGTLDEAALRGRIDGLLALV